MAELTTFKIHDKGNGKDMPLSAIRTCRFGSDSSAETGILKASKPRVRNCCCGVSWFRSKYNALRKKPLWVLLSLICMGLVIGLSMWGVLEAADRHADDARGKAFMVAKEQGLYLRAVLMGAMLPASNVATLIKQYAFDLPALEATFRGCAPDILDLEQSSSVFNIQIAPNAIIHTVIPIRGFEGGEGLDLMRLRSRRPYALRAISSRKPITSGPELLPVGIWAFVALHPVFIPDVDMYETFNFPEVYGVPNEFNPTRQPTHQLYNNTFGRAEGHGLYETDGAGCDKDLCYINATRSKFWGFGKSVVSWEVAKHDSKLYDLCGKYDFVMTVTDPDGSERCIAMCSDTRMIPTKYPDMWNGTLGPYTLEDYKKKNPMKYTLSALQNTWHLYLVNDKGGMMAHSNGGSWDPVWKAPLIAILVVVPVLLCVLALLLMAMGIEQEELLEAEVEAREQLECEKKHTDALVVRQLNLISCFSSVKDDRSKLGAESSRLSMEQATHSRIEAVRRHLNTGQNTDDQIVVQELLGEGAFGKVYKGLWRGGEVAIKTIMLPANMSGAAKRERMAIMEAAISTSMTHPNVVQTYTYAIRPILDHEKENNEPIESIPGMVQLTLTETEGVDASKNSQGRSGGSSLSQGSSLGPSEASIISYEVRLVLEFCDVGTLREALDAGLFYSNCFNYKAILDTASDIAKAMLHLHLANVLHLDLKSCNVMLKSCGSEGRGLSAKVADFGLSVSLDPDQTHMSQMFQGTLTHMAPEVLMSGSISKAADVYAFGITLYELLTGEHAFKDLHKAHLGHAITTGNVRPKFGLVCPKEYRELAELCWHREPEMRPTFTQVLAQLGAMRVAEKGSTANLDVSMLKKQKKHPDMVPFLLPTLDLQSAKDKVASSSRGSKYSQRMSDLDCVPEGRESMEESVDESCEES